MMQITTRDELIAAGLSIVRERGLIAVLPDFTVRELIDRADGPTRSAFQNAWPQRGDFERQVLEEVLAERANHPPLSITSIPRALDLMESGPDVAQFMRHAYLNAGGEAQQRDLRDRIAVTCLASGDPELAEFAAHSETARYAHEDSVLVQIFRIAGMAFGFQSAPGFTLLDLAKIIGPLMDGMSLQRLSDPAAEFNDHTWNDSSGWSLEAIATDALLATLTVPIGSEHTVPVRRNPHPTEVSRPTAQIAAPRRPPTTRSLLLDAGVAIANERGLYCALPPFTVGDLLNRVSASVTEGAFHHNWPRKVDFEAELMSHLMAPDTRRAYLATVELSELGDQAWTDASEALHHAAALSMARPADLNFMLLSTLAGVDDVGVSVVNGLNDGFGFRIDAHTGALEALGQRHFISPRGQLTWNLVARMNIAVTDGMLLRAISDERANEPSLAPVGQASPRSLLGFAYEGFFDKLLEPSDKHP